MLLIRILDIMDILLRGLDSLLELVKQEEDIWKFLWEALDESEPRDREIRIGSRATKGTEL